MTPPEFVRVASLPELRQMGEQFKTGGNAASRAAGDQVTHAPASQKWHTPGWRRESSSPLKLTPLETFGRVMRGIATGDNAFFVLTEAQRQQSALADDCVLPCLAKAGYALGSEFSAEDFIDLQARNKPVWLVNLCGRETLPAVKRYIERGIATGVNLRYLTRSRSPWYALEQRPPAPLLATTFSRNGIRWVRNTAGVTHLTAFHGFYPHPGTDLDLLHACLLTPLAQRILANNRREYGNGLHKFEPNDLNRALVADIREIEPDAATAIKSLYAKLGGDSSREPTAAAIIEEINEMIESQ